MSSSPLAVRLLKQALGETKDFREGQLEAILALVDRRARVLVVQRTGWGKSVVYFIATRLLREQGSGPTILISPLLSLMRDQVRMAKALGIRAINMDSTNTSSWDDVEAALAADEVDLLLVSPERLANERFRTRTLASIPREIGLFVVRRISGRTSRGAAFSRRPACLRTRAACEPRHLGAHASGRGLPRPVQAAIARADAARPFRRRAPGRAAATRNRRRRVS